MKERWSYEDLERAFNEFCAELQAGGQRARKQQRILQAATELFIRHGYRKVTIDEVAREAGVAKGTIYLYYKSKTELMMHAILEEKRHYLERFRTVFEGDMTPRERLKEWLRRGLVVAAEAPLISKLQSGDREILHVLDEIGTDLKERALAGKLDFLTGMIAATSPGSWSEEEIRDRAKVLVAIFQGGNFFVEAETRNGLPLERFADLMADVLVDGVLSATREESEDRALENVAAGRA